MKDGPPQKRHHYTRSHQADSLVDIRLSDELDMGFMARLLIQATLPHSEQDIREYERRNGNLRLIVQATPGMNLPYGSYPRLLLAWITTEAVRTQKPTLVLGTSLSQFMEQLGLLPTGGRWGTITRLRDQMKRLFSARIAAIYDSDEEGTYQSKTMEITNEVNLWWNPKSPEQATIWESTITLTDKFFQEIINRPVPFDIRILRALKRSPLGLDLYMWLTYRASYLKTPTAISWKQLHAQFGADYSDTRDFTKKAKRELKKISAAWPELNYETPRGRLKLYPSTPSVLPA